MPSFWLGTISILVFLLMFFNTNLNYKSFFKENEILILFGFIIFTYLSIFWSSSSVFEGDFNTNFTRFKYYFFLIPAIYFANYSRQQLILLIHLVVLSPILIIFVYYTNIIGITDIYSFHSKGTNPYIGHYLVTNVFILFSSLFLYIKLIESIRSRSYQQVITYSLLFLFVSGSLFIDERNVARLVNLAYIIMIFAVPMFYISNKLKLFILLSALILVPLLLLNSTKFKMGLQKFEKAIQEDKYEGSWGHRTGFAIVGLKIFSESPILGRGMNDVSAEIKRIKQKEPKYFTGDRAIRIHNGHINFLAQIGIIGYLFLLYLFYSLWKIKIQDHTINTYKNMILILYLVLMIGEHYLSIKQTSNLFAILIAIFLVYRKNEFKENKLT